VAAALAELRDDVPDLDPGDVLGPVTIGDDAVRALVRFDYARGARITESLRSSVIAAALRARKATRGRQPGVRNTLRLRVDVPDLDL
jgi:primosomal protein N' (replication factor Y)